MDGISHLTKLTQTRDPGPVRPSPGTSPSAAAGAKSEAGIERVTITDAARALLAARAPGTSETPVDDGRVAALRQAIADGTYRADSDRIAAKMLQMEQP